MVPRRAAPLAKTKPCRSAPRTPAPLDLPGPVPGGDPLGSPTRTLPAILNPFARDAQPAVMTRLLLDWIIDEPVLGQLFDRTAKGQYTREWTLAHLVGVLTDVACGFRPSPRAAFRRRRLQEIASISSFYRKLDRMEPEVAAAVVRHTAGPARKVTVATEALLPEPITGYACRVLDGNALAGT